MILKNQERRIFNPLSSNIFYQSISLAQHLSIGVSRKKVVLCINVFIVKKTVLFGNATIVMKILAMKAME
jgi:hypothetical protein